MFTLDYLLVFGRPLDGERGNTRSTCKYCLPAQIWGKLTSLAAHWCSAQLDISKTLFQERFQVQTLGSTLAEIEYEVTEFSQSLSDPGWNVYLCPIDQFYLFPGLKSMAKWQCPKQN